MLIERIKARGGKILPQDLPALKPEIKIIVKYEDSSQKESSTVGLLMLELDMPTLTKHRNIIGVNLA